MTERSKLDLYCPNCEARELTVRREHEEFLYGTGRDAVKLKAEIQVHTCKKCGFEFSDAESSEARHVAVCRHLKVYTPEEVRAVRERYRLSQEEFAVLTRLGKASLNRWENGTLIQNSANDQYLYLLSFPDNLQRIRSRGKSVSEPMPETISNIVEFKPRFKELPQRDSSKVNSDSAAFELFVSPTRR
jgi:putative zinc finger/helix-turn-helix YgiT family protein